MPDSDREPGDAPADPRTSSGILLLHLLFGAALLTVLLWPGPLMIRGAPLGRGWAVAIVLTVWAWAVLRFSGRRKLAILALAAAPVWLLLGLRGHLGLPGLPGLGPGPGEPGLAALPAAADGEMPPATGPATRDDLPVISASPLAVGERTERLGLVEERVFRERSDDPRYAFYDPDDVTFDAEGNLYVADSDNHRIQVFGPAGDYLRTLGQEGQGPGDLRNPSNIALLGDRLIVHEWGNNRLSIWRLDGTFVESARLVDADAAWDSGIGIVRRLEPAGETLVALLQTRDGANLRDRAGRIFKVVPIGLDGRVRPPWLQVPDTHQRLIVEQNRAGSTSIGMPLPQALPDVAASDDGRVYVTDGATYDVVAFGPDGEPRWRLRAHWEVPPHYNDAEWSQALARWRATASSRFRDADFSGIPREEVRRPAIRRMMVDGHGHLYVYPGAAYAGHPSAEPPEGEVPVDVYSPQGDLLFSGLVPSAGYRLEGLAGDRAFTRDLLPPEGLLQVTVFCIEEPF